MSCNDKLSRQINPTLCIVLRPSSLSYRHSDPLACYMLISLPLVPHLKTADRRWLWWSLVFESWSLKLRGNYTPTDCHVVQMLSPVMGV